MTGTTGYIGGSVLTKLLEPSQKGKYDITAYIRSEAVIPKYQELGVKTLVGSLESADILKQAAIDADVVFHFADSADHLPSAKALIEGLKTQDGKRRIYIHTSGTGELADDARGNSTTTVVYDDLDLDPIKALPVTQIHKDVDDYIFANNEGYEAIIVAPPAIFGDGTGPVNQRSIQIPVIIKGFLKAGKAGSVGKGINIWDGIHINDLTNFYALLLEKALEGKASIGKDGWYFCETGFYAMGDIYKKVAEELYKQKAISSPDVPEFTPEEVEKIFGKFGWTGLGSNSRSTANRARQLGWKADPTNPGVLDTIADEVKFYIEKEGLIKN